ncbi:aminopeptidase N [Zwartia sp.]|uniref:aminopeptidase N n=1 Tax=Zwartia sp. TaxID=2978004 RepID=UPI00272046C9|nr:aminopeptidase N [Zwartia sp.]MDO9023973.1 aminopeptidase N [Zwartia sp.]
MRTETGTTIRREDYRPFAFIIPTVQLEFELEPELTWVKALFLVERRNDLSRESDLILHGEELALISIHVNGIELGHTQYALTDTTLTIKDLPDRAEVLIVSTCQPAHNTSLSGLYVSGKSLFTQCEAQGFRKIIWFADRPDIMSVYHVTLRADRHQYPLLLSNGNLVLKRELEENRHEAQWHDPFAKPSYLFALVAGDFACREHSTKTASGRDVLLQVYSDPGTENQTQWAMESLERSLRWDEQRFGLELDLDRFMIVAARDFNMGAMENKGLNIFNAAYVLANPNTATDSNYQAIEAVIGHEYFHNWTGNRVTCRDWFELSLKEGLTVFRDQEFTADMMAQGLDAEAAASARAIKRIDDVVTLRAAQFPEDSGPMAHPIRPESYQEIGNFYTATVYEKGAEVIRMMHTLLGETAFRAGMDEYFRRHDGQAVTCDDFVAAMNWSLQNDHPEKSLDQFKRWYSQAGTPRVNASLTYDEKSKRCTLTLSQQCDPVGVEKKSTIRKLPFHIPVTIGMLDDQGQALLLRKESDKGPPVTELLLELTQETQSWTFEDLSAKPTPSLLRNFSAPVNLVYPYTDQELALLSAHDSNAFARWEAGQELATRQILKMAQTWRAKGQMCAPEPVMLQAWGAMLQDHTIDAGYKARALSLPVEKTVLERMSPMDPIAVSTARAALRRLLGERYVATLMMLYQDQATPGPYSPAPGPAGKRALKNLALSYLIAAKVHEAIELAFQQFRHATNMTDRMAAFHTLTHEAQGVQTSDAVTKFYEDWQHDPLVIDKWFAVQASSPLTSAEAVRGLMAHPAFTLRNPNRARSVIFQFCSANPLGLHAPDGSGYTFWADQVLALDHINPEIAARLARAFDHWSRFIPTVRDQMRTQLQRVSDHPDLSRNTQEIVSKALAL